MCDVPRFQVWTDFSRAMSGVVDAEKEYLRARDAAVRDGLVNSDDIREDEPAESEEQHSTLDDSLSADASAALKEEGNELFKSGCNEAALEKYTAALRSGHLSSEDRAILLANRAAVYLRLERWSDVIDDASAALKLKPGYQKAHMRRKRAAEKVEDWGTAATDAKALGAPRAEIAALELRAKQKTEKETAEALEQLKGLGNSFLSNFGLSLDSFQMDKDPSTGSYSIRMKE